MKCLSVPDMKCEMCTKRISAALSDNGIKFSISLSEKTVSVDEEKVSEALEILDNLGFTAE